MGSLLMRLTMVLRGFLAVSVMSATIALGVMFLISLFLVIWILPQKEADEFKEKMYGNH